MTISTAQVGDCLLGIGGRDTETIVQVFQLSDEQQAKMQEWIGELEIHQEKLKAEMQGLLEDHPQETEDDMYRLGGKVAVFKEALERMQREYDGRLLSILNTKQYQRYADLCQEVDRQPIPIDNPE